MGLIIAADASRCHGRGSSVACAAIVRLKQAERKRWKHSERERAERREARGERGEGDRARKGDSIRPSESNRREKLRDEKNAKKEKECV
jgi:hypothetical protein